MSLNILIFCYYLPAIKYGGPEKSIYNLVEAMKDQVNFYIISPDHDFGETEKLKGIQPGWNNVGGANVVYDNEKKITVKYISTIIKEKNINIVYLQSVYGKGINLMFAKAAHLNNIPILIAPRSDLLPNCINLKRTKKVLFLNIVNIFKLYNGAFYQSTSDEETESVLKWMKTSQDKVFQIPNIASSKLNISREMKIKGQLRLLYAGRVHPRKNLKYAVERISEAQGNISIDVYGNMEDQEYWNECVEISKNWGPGKQLNYKGVVSQLEMQKKYYHYDALFFPTLNENYGHVIVEAMIADCPAIISKGTTPWDDYDHNGGYCIDLKNPKGFDDVLEKLCAMDAEEYNEIEEKNEAYVKTHFNNAKLKKQYIDMFNKCIGNS